MPPHNNESDLPEKKSAGTVRAIKSRCGVGLGIRPPKGGGGYVSPVWLVVLLVASSAARAEEWVVLQKPPEIGSRNLPFAKPSSACLHLSTMAWQIVSKPV
jgi:hypothetical protein